MTYKSSTGTIVYNMIEDNVTEIKNGFQELKMSINKALNVAGNTEIWSD